MAAVHEGIIEYGGQGGGIVCIFMWSSRFYAILTQTVFSP
jgi:hypothetical protein